MGIDQIPPADRAPARLQDESGAPAVERQQRSPPVAPSREDRWESSDATPEDELDSQAPSEPDGEEEEGEEEDAGQAEADDKPRRLDARA
jgi:hypothetical protein